MLKINGMIKVILTKIEPEKIPDSDFPSLKSKFEITWRIISLKKKLKQWHLCIQMMLVRVKNMRLKIIEALNDKKMMDAIEDLIEKL